MVPLKKIFFAFAVLFLPVIFSVGGCNSPQEHREEADEEVYGIIESKWEEQFGVTSGLEIENGPTETMEERAATLIPESGKLNLVQAVNIATNYNREYQRQKEILYLTVLDLTFERHQFVRQWFGTIDASYAKDEFDESVGNTSRFGFDQLLAGGGVISMNIAQDWTSFLTGDSRTSLGTFLNASITQPLLGSGRLVAEENLTQAERDALYEIRSFSRFRKEFVVDVVSAYYRVLQQKDAVLNAENNYERVKLSLERLKAEAEEGRKPMFEVDQAEQSVLDAEDGVVTNQQRYEQLLDQFKILLALPTDAAVELDENELDALAASGVSSPDYDLETAIETGLVSRLDLATSMDQIDDAVRKVTVAEDELGMDLGVFASAGVPSTEQTRAGRLRFNDGTYEFGLTADLPLDRLSERNQYRSALINLAVAERQYESDISGVKLDIRDSWRQLREAEQRYLIQQNSLELARKRVESTTVLLEEGRAQTRDLLEAQDDLLAAENSLTAAIIDHAVSKLNFFLDIEILQVKPDGMWDTMDKEENANG